MWLLFGLIAIMATVVNLYRYKRGKNFQLAMAIALSFTCLTLLASYQMVSAWVMSEDWAALSDVVPTMSTVFWLLAVLSILLNITPAFLGLKSKK